MSVILYHFFSNDPNEHASPVHRISEIPNFYLTLTDFWMPRPYQGVTDAAKAFNEFQKSDVPSWEKILANVGVDNSFIEREDRARVAIALRTASVEYTPAKGGRDCPGLSELTDKLLDLETNGPCLVTNSFNPYLCNGQSLTLPQARTVFPRALDFPSTVKEDQLYLLRHDVIGNLLSVSKRT